MSRLQERNSVASHDVDDSVLVRQSARPHVRAESLEWLGLANPNERIAEDHPNEIQKPQRQFPLVRDEMGKVLDELLIKDGIAGSCCQSSP